MHTAKQPSAMTEIDRINRIQQITAMIQGNCVVNRYAKDELQRFTADLLMELSPVKPADTQDYSQCPPATAARTSRG